MCRAQKLGSHDQGPAPDYGSRTLRIGHNQGSMSDYIFMSPQKLLIAFLPNFTER